MVRSLVGILVAQAAEESVGAVNEQMALGVFFCFEAFEGIGGIERCATGPVDAEIEGDGVSPSRVVADGSGDTVGGLSRSRFLCLLVLLWFC